jgi:hypothetical protein
MQASKKGPVKPAIKEGTMHQLLGVLRDVAIGAVVLLGIGLLIEVTSTAVELVAMR